MESGEKNCLKLVIEEFPEDAFGLKDILGMEMRVIETIQIFVNKNETFSNMKWVELALEGLRIRCYSVFPAKIRNLPVLIHL